MTTPTSRSFAILAAAALGASLPHASGNEAAPASLHMRIEAQIFDEPLRTASFRLLECVGQAASSPASLDNVYRRSQSFYVHAQRYRTMYGERSWTAARPLVAEVFSQVDAQLAQVALPEYTKNAIERYRSSLLSEAGQSR